MENKTKKKSSWLRGRWISLENISFSSVKFMHKSLIVRWEYHTQICLFPLGTHFAWIYIKSLNFSDYLNETIPSVLTAKLEKVKFKHYQFEKSDWSFTDGTLACTLHFWYRKKRTLTAKYSKLSLSLLLVL